MLDCCAQFCLEGRTVACRPHGGGHINRSFRVETDAGEAYLLQKINRDVFPDVPALMANLEAVTAHLARREPDPRRRLRLIPTVAGQSWYQDTDGACWRMFPFIENSLCLDAPETDADLYQSGLAFGRFQRQMADLPAGTLRETLPHFHDTPRRYEALREAIAADPLGRAATCREEIAFALRHEPEADGLTRLLREGKLPLRVTHNDAKLSNVLLDADTREALCVVDLDTVMPGLAAFDYGDAIRFGASTAAEDETDLTRVTLSQSRLEAYTRGYLTACGDALTPLEVETLPLGAKLMTLECGVRFLTDYLLGDVYYRIARPNHNLDRARTQLRLVDCWDKF